MMGIVYCRWTPTWCKPPVISLGALRTSWLFVTRWFDLPVGFTSKSWRKLGVALASGSSSLCRRCCSCRPCTQIPQLSKRASVPSCSIRAVEFPYNYTYKGPDRTCLEAEDEVHELRNNLMRGRMEHLRNAGSICHAFDQMGAAG